MDVGMYAGIRFLPSRPQPLEPLYRNYLEDAVYGEQLGFDFIRISEHHFAPDAWCPSQLPILGWLAGRTSRMRLGTNVLLLPFHHPLRVAEDAATVDIMSGGRLDLAVGSGSITDEFETYNLDPDERWGRMFEGLEVIRRCFTEDVFDHHGKYFHFPNVRMTTKPVQQPLPLWVGATGPKTIRRAARLGYHMAGGGAGNAKAVYESVGRDPKDFNVFVFIRGHLAETKDKAWDESEASLHHERGFYAERDWIGGPEMRDKPVPPVGEFRHDASPGGMNNAVGTPDDVLRQLEPRLKNSLVTHFGFGFRHAGMATEPVRRAMEVFARELMPELRTWGRDPSPRSAGHEVRAMQIDFGIWDHFERRRDVPVEQQYQEKIKLLREAEGLGFYCYHIAEHHLTPLDLAPSPNVFLAAVAQATSRLRVGSMVHILPLYHPVRIVQEICMLDNISGGRLDFGIGRGARSIEHRWSGVDPEESRQRSEETLAIIVASLSSGNLAYQGQFYQIDDAPLDLLPVQKPYPPIWYAGGWEFAGRNGLNFLGRSAGDLTGYWGLWQQMRRRGDGLNPQIAVPKAGVNRQIVVRESDEEARAVARRAQAAHALNFNATSLGYPGGRIVPQMSSDIEDERARDRILYGSPATVRSFLERLIGEIGDQPSFYFTTANQWGDISHEEALESMRLFASEVMPAFRPTQAAAGD